MPPVFPLTPTSPDAAHDAAYMQQALHLAAQAGAQGEVPIGALVVCDGTVIATGFNRREQTADPSAHAEFIAITEAARALGRWRLPDCTVYVTLEPCPMCAGLMHQARIGRCVYAASDPKAGALGSLYDLAADERLNHTFAVTAGVEEEASSALLKGFFAARRARPAKKAADEFATAAQHTGAPQPSHSTAPRWPADEDGVAPRPAWMKDAALDETIVSTERAYEGRIFDIDHLVVELPDGTTARRDVVRHPGAAAVLALDTQDRVLLVDQWRSALGHVLCEIPAGKLEPGEDPRAAAARELAEETGIRAGSLSYLTTFATSAGFSDERLHIYRATDLTQGTTARDTDEFMTVRWVPFDEALAAARDGRIQDAKTVIALLLHQARRIEE